MTTTKRADNKITLMGEMERFILLAVIKEGRPMRPIEIKWGLMEHLGFEISDATLYTALHSMARKGYLEVGLSKKVQNNGHVTRLYGITDKAKELLMVSLSRIVTLVNVCDLNDVDQLKKGDISWIKCQGL